MKARARLAEGAAADRILEVAREEACDVIVVGTRGRSGMDTGLCRDRRLPPGVPRAALLRSESALR